MKTLDLLLPTLAIGAYSTVGLAQDDPLVLYTGITVSLGSTIALIEKYKPIIQKYDEKVIALYERHHPSHTIDQYEGNHE